MSNIPVFPENFNWWFVLFICLAWLCESMMDTIAFHKHSSWIFKIKWSPGITRWLLSEWKDKSRYIAGYDGWHTFKGLMLIFLAIAISIISGAWLYGLIFLLSYMIIHEIFFGDILIVGGRKL